MADRLLAQSDAEFAIDLGDRYAASGLYAQAAKCHSMQGLRQWAGDRGEGGGKDASVGGSRSHHTGESTPSGDDITTLLAFDADIDGFCCDLTEPVWRFLSSWLKSHSQEPSLDRRLLHFVKAKESAQNYLQQSCGQAGSTIRSLAKGQIERSARRFSLSGDQSDVALDESTVGPPSTPVENSIRQIDLNIRMVGLQRALAVTPEDVEAFCEEVSAAAAGPADRSMRQSISRLGDCRSLLSLLIDLQRVVYAPLELLDLLNSCINESGMAEHVAPYFPSIAALRLSAQRVTSAAARSLAGFADDEEAARAALDDACMAFLSFGASASKILQQPRIVSDALKDLMALPDTAVRESCSRSLKRLSVVLHVYARTQWGNKEVTMANAEGENVQIPAFLWPAWRLAECGQSFDTLISLYLSFEDDELAKQQCRLDAEEFQTIFCWIFDQWLTSQDDVAAASTYVGLLHELTKAGDLPYFGSPVSVPLWSQLNEEECARADVAAQKLTDMLLQIELAMTHASRSVGSLKDNRHFLGVHSRLAIIKQQVSEYRAALHRQAMHERFATSF
ncbi:hypothetical protein, conserved [Eimeria praecox]|uniref:Nuclear pore complex protein n=1 Tax=Eimeria praecox TaxID=51316 RepID=U6G8F1_9EIME|nr:hypothetical protein, conserved [Eimeria praecox]